jgi:two-component system, chemotaxis family, chemotaxis protein CheY
MTGIIFYLQTMKILMVDDETDAQALFLQRFRQEIRSNEAQFAFACSGNEAIGYLDQHSHEPIVVLSDINMPGMSGLDLLRHIKEQYASPPPVVMMITAYGDEQNYRDAIQLGAADLLTKPVDFRVLKEKLKSLISRPASVHG